MFDHFTFGAEASGQRGPDIAFSPTDDTLSPPTSPQMGDASLDGDIEMGMAVASLSIDDIMRGLREQTLQSGDNIARPPPWAPPAMPDRPDETKAQQPSHRAHHSLPNIHLAPGPRPGPASCRRLQRQLNVQLQSSKTHMRDVKALVEDMVLTNSQCVLRDSAARARARARHARYNLLPSPPPSRAGPPPCDLTVDPMMFGACPPSPSPDADEGFHEDERPPEAEEDKPEDEQFVYRRACAPGGIRKSAITAEYMRGTDHIVVGGRVLVRSKPRMRKRTRRPPPSAD